MITSDFLQLRPTILPNSSDCNLRCGYCYCHREENKRHSMSLEILEITLRKFINEYPGFISFCWHGGEPLLSGLDFFEKTCEIQKKYKAENQIIENRLQTNATLINQEWASFFKEHNFKVGVSIDGPKWLNDRQRLFESGHGSYSKTTKGINILRENGIPFSVLFTVTRENVKYPKEIYEFVVEEKFATVKFNPCFGNNKWSVNFTEYAYFMNDIFDLWVKEDREELSLGPTEDIMKGLLGGNPNVCHMRNTCYRHVKIDYNGDVIPCDTFLGKNFKFGNTVNQEINEIVNTKNYLSFFNAVKSIPNHCSKCKWYFVCGSGCSRHSFEGSLRKNKNKMCESRKIMFKHIANFLGIK